MTLVQINTGEKCHTLTLFQKREHSERLAKSHTVTFSNISNGILAVWLELNLNVFSKYAFGYLISI